MRATRKIADMIDDVWMTSFTMAGNLTLCGPIMLGTTSVVTSSCERYSKRYDSETGCRIHDIHALSAMGFTSLIVQVEV